MAHPLRLEVFEMADLSEGPSVLMPEDLEELRLTAYERGYIAGWDDSARQADAEASARQAQVAARIEALTFGYHEARNEILTGLGPLLSAMIDTLLPAVARAAVIPLVIEHLLPLAVARAESPLRLRVPAGTAADFQHALSGLALPPLTVTETGDLTAYQAEILANTDEIRIDLSAALTRIEAAITAFQTASSQESRRA
jgi:hypothetical protein